MRTIISLTCNIFFHPRRVKEGRETENGATGDSGRGDASGEDSEKRA